MLGDIRRAEIVITNYHAFQHRETLALAEGRAQLPAGQRPRADQDDRDRRARCSSGPAASCSTTTASTSSTTRRTIATAHKVGGDDEEALTGDEQGGGGGERGGGAALDQRHRGAGAQGQGVRAVYDLSATPFFLRGSGYAEGTLFPWVVSDFSLMDAIECGIVKLPRVPVTDNLARPTTADLPRSVEAHRQGPAEDGGGRRQAQPVRSARTCCRPRSTRSTAITRASSSVGSAPGSACRRCSSSCARTPRPRSSSSNGSPASSAASGGGRARRVPSPAHLELFRNYDDQGGRLARPRHAADRRAQIESGEALDKEFRDAAGPEIEQFKRELRSARRRRRRRGRDQRERAAARGDEHGRPRRPARRADPLRRLGLDADRGLGHQHRHPHPRRARVRHPAAVRAGGRPRPAPPVLRAQPEDGPVRRRICRHHGHPVRLRRHAAGGEADHAEAGHARPRDQGASASWRSSSRASSGYRARSAVREARGRVHRGQPAARSRRPTSVRPRSCMEGHRRRRRRPSRPRCWSGCARRRSASTSPSTCSTRASATRTASRSSICSRRSSASRARWIDEGYLVTKGVPIGAILYQDQLATRRRRRSTSPARAAARARHRGGARSLQPEGLDALRQFHHLEDLSGRPARSRRSATSATSCSISELGGAARADAGEPSARARLRQEPGAAVRDALSRRRRRRGATCPTSSCGSTTAATSRST